MWSSDAKLSLTGRPARRLLLGAAMVGLIALPMAGCGDAGGFRPMYAASPNGVRLDEKLAKVEITPVPTRVGQRIRNELIFQNTGGGAQQPPVYRLTLAVRESVSAMLVTSTGVAQSNVYAIDATFTLIDIKSKKVLLTGTSYGRAGFDRYPSIYSNVRAQQDAENHAAASVAEDLKSRLAAFLSSDKV